MRKQRRTVDDFLAERRRGPQPGGAIPVATRFAMACYIAQDELHGTAVEAIEFAIELGMEAGSFLSIWQDGDWKTMHLEWPDFPAKVRAKVQPRASK